MNFASDERQHSPLNHGGEYQGIRDATITTTASPPIAHSAIACHTPGNISEERRGRTKASMTMTIGPWDSSIKGLSIREALQHWTAKSECFLV